MTLDHFYHEGCTILSSLELRTLSRYGFAFLVSNAFVRITINWLVERLIHYHGIPYSIVYNHGTHFTIKKVIQWPHSHGIHLFNHVFHHPKALLDRTVEWSCEDSEHQLVVIPFQACTRFSLRLHMLWISGQYKVLLLPYPGFMGPGIKEWKSEWHHPLISLVTHWQNSFLPVCMTLCCTGLQVLVPAERS